MDENVIDHLPEWQCHKVVRAGKITLIDHMADDSAMLRLEFEPKKQFDIIQASVKVSDAWMVKHKPEIGGYFVAYDDGYLSYSPAHAFESGYTRKL